MFQRKTQSITDGRAQPSNRPRTKPLYSASSDSMARLPLKPWTAILSWGCPLFPGLPGGPISPAVDGLASRRNFNIFLVMGLARGMRRVDGVAAARRLLR